jgi:two-component system cell cycle sensor histidine kinase/response regulator CckA
VKTHESDDLRAAELRRRAEESLSARPTEQRPDKAADVVRLVHELQVHQIELEMQNEELQRSRREAEAALERYAELYDFAPVGYFTLASDSTVRQCNLTGARLIGVERASVTSLRLGAFVAEADRPAFNAAMARAFDAGGQASCEVALVPPKGQDAPVHVQLTISASEVRQDVRVVATDVTERARAEEQLMASQKMEAVGRLAGGVAHDFNNMLTVILNRCDYELRSAGSEDSRHNLRELEAAAQHAAALTAQLLAFSRKQVLRAEVVDVNEVAREVATKMLDPLLGEDIEVALSLAVDLGRIEVDPTQLEQVILNLGVNARDAMPRGGKLTLSTANVELDQGRCDKRGLSVMPGSFVLVRVTDSGEGMDAATMARIFEPFFTTKEKGRGTGLGLATVYGVVRQCGGDIAVQSELGEGTTFEVYFPRTTSPRRSSSRPAPSAEPPPGGRETILVVEDEEAVLRIARLTLGAAGYEVLFASSGAEALAICARNPGEIHLALSDVVMPGMTGVAFVERLKRVRPATRVLYMSGYSEEALDARGAIASKQHLLGKPFTTEALLRKVREVLDEGGRPMASP